MDAFERAKGCAPAPDGAEPPELTIRRGRGDTDAELYEQLLDYWREERATVRALREEVAVLRVSLQRLLWHTQKHVDDDTLMCACCFEHSYPWRRYHHKDYCPFALLNEEAPDASQ
jgi:hypothetical protein